MSSLNRPWAADAQRALDAAVAKNAGFGGGVLRIESLSAGLLWEGASGRLAVGGPPRAPNDAFEIASITKTFVAVTVLRLSEDGLIELDAPLGRYLPANLTRGILTIHHRDYGASITIRQLLGHRSGLPDYWTDPPFVASKPDENAFLMDFLADANRLWTAPEIVAYLRGLTPIARPGLRYHYADSGFVLLGLVIEHVTGRPLHEYIRTTLLAPLHMQDTHWSYHEAAPAGVRESHRYEGPLDLNGQRRQSADWGGGGLVSTTTDLGRFMGALARGDLFARRDTFAAFKRWLPTGEPGIDYGLGVFRIELGQGMGDLWGHDGHGNSFMFYWPDRQLLWIGTLDQTENSWWDMVEPLLQKVSASGGRSR